MCLALVVASSLIVPAAGELHFTRVTVATTASPRRVAAALIDGDHFADVMVMQAGDRGSALLQVYLNVDGHGPAVPGWSLPAWDDGASLVADVDLADTDLDGDNDVVFCVGLGAPGQRFNDGQGHFDEQGYVPTLSGRFENELLDMNGDHAVDLVYYEPDFFGDSYFGTMIGDGNGKFWWGSNEIQFLVEIEVHRRIALGDITGDGLIDAVFTSVHTGGLRFIEATPGTPVPDWKLPKLVYAPPCNDAVIADLDRDGRPDVVATARDLDSVAVFVTSPAGQVGTPHLHPAGDAPDALVVADFDLDGFPDVLVANPTQGTVQVLRGLGTGELGPARALRVGQAPNDIATADFDNDGDLDAVIACADHLTLLLNDALSPSGVHFTQK